MNLKMERLLENEGGNYILPFFWQHGEDEAVLRDYMKAIDENHIKAVCIESRPHPDFCGPKWWKDMDVILEEARNRNMKVWILDDSHFPTGYAHGAMATQPDERCRQSICYREYICNGNDILQIEKEQLYHPDPFQPSQIEMMIGDKNPRQFNDDRLLGIFAVPIGEDAKVRFEEFIDLQKNIQDHTLTWLCPDGQWKVYVLHLSRNMGYHRSYINMMDPVSCKVLIDAVYEPHYARYQSDFGTTIAGFFSDEPELGNGHLYEKNIMLGTNNDFPWSSELEKALENILGKEYALLMALLWEEKVNADLKARIRYTYMDQVTRLVEANFSKQIGEWCRAHEVQYIGHLIEDNNMHARTGSSLGHYYRGLSGQDMAGIDDIGGQVLPQAEDIDCNNGPFNSRIGEFYHYMLGKLANSAAAIEPLKKGNAMCEIFGAYGWSAGLHLEKYLLDHFMVRGINHYVPHAYSAKAYPDPDCPPHFYAGGHNPQHRHFGALMAYTNRVCELISDGIHIAPIAVIYHGEGEWTGSYMVSHRIGHILADEQVDYDYLPQDVFYMTSEYKTEIKSGVLKVNTQTYKAIVVPTMQFITKTFAATVIDMVQAGIQVWFIDSYPEGICDEESPENAQILLRGLRCAELVAPEKLSEKVKQLGICEISLQPANNRVRYYHYEHLDGAAIYLFINEGDKIYEGEILLSDGRHAYRYDAWDNHLERAEFDGKSLHISLEPLKSYILVLDPVLIDQNQLKDTVDLAGHKVTFNSVWKRSLCKSIDYPTFGDKKEVTLPDQLAKEEPKFSGFVRYDNQCTLEQFNQVVIEITEAYEGVEVIVNGRSCGIQIVPKYVFDITKACHEGQNHISIEVATTLERENADTPNMFGQITPAQGFSGITGEVNLYLK